MGRASGTIDLHTYVYYAKFPYVIVLSNSTYLSTFTKYATNMIDTLYFIIYLINNNNISASFSGSMSARYKMGSKMAEVCQNLGFSLSGGDLGYQTFLYNNENDLRSVLMFLIDKLPKEQNMDIGEEQEIGKV